MHNIELKEVKRMADNFMYDDIEKLEMMIEELKDDDVALESLDEFIELTKGVISKIDSIVATNEKLVDVLKLHDERISELERAIFGSNPEY